MTEGQSLIPAPGAAPELCGMGETLCDRETSPPSWLLAQHRALSGVRDAPGVTQGQGRAGLRAGPRALSVCCRIGATSRSRHIPFPAQGQGRSPCPAPAPPGAFMSLPDRASNTPGREQTVQEQCSASKHSQTLPSVPAPAKSPSEPGTAVTRQPRRPPGCGESSWSPASPAAWGKGKPRIRPLGIISSSSAAPWACPMDGTRGHEAAGTAHP